LHRKSKLPQGPRDIVEVSLKRPDHIISWYHCLLAHPNPSFHNLSLSLTLYRLQHQSLSIYSTFTNTISSIITTASPNLLFFYHHHLLLLLLLLFSCHITCTQYLSKQDDFPCLHFFGSFSEPGHEIGPFPVADPDSDYERL